MGEGKSSTLVHILVVVLSLTAFGFAIAAERRRSTQNWTCASLRKGVFIAGAVFVVFTMVLNAYYYIYFAKAADQAARSTNRPKSSIGIAGYK
ncbi:hypothetical protein KSP40_PGU013193 [Platanthera guangdongensis]|uniref:Uncharacterized protein n=1 Tax=Platanthera guangdongensis TaxID=2320717 RepID=A0ABR2MMM5_9ASPA